MELQSGIVLAVVIGSIFLVDRLGGSDELMRRGYQVGLAVAIAATVLAATAIFVDADSSFLSGDGLAGEESDVANHTLIASAAHYVAGVFVLVGGLRLSARLTTIPVGMVTGGTLLLLFGGNSGISQYDLFSVYRNLAAEQWAEISFFIMLAGGLVVLLAFGHERWERPQIEGEAPPDVL
jgi:hypothetical protein